MLEKTFDPKSVEPRLYQRWEASGAFAPERVLACDPAAKPFSMVIPPPNVTGSLHMGHALYTLEDVLIRWKRMRGFNALWVPGTDHAGIATQKVVSDLLFKTEKKTRHDLGREEFLKRVWDWKAKSGGRIHEQFRVMGFSCAWSYHKFTMDEGPSRAVTEAFVRLYEANHSAPFALNMALLAGLLGYALINGPLRRADPQPAAPAGASTIAGLEKSDEAG